MQINLNSQQLEAVNHKTGPLLIIAGAGTGKTAVITQRIIELINSGSAKPSEILALTFTEKATTEMEERVDQEMPIGYDEIWISTFHSFCDRVLRQDGIYIGLNSDYTLMSTAQSYIFFRKHLYDFSLDRFRPLGNPTKNIGDILKHFSRLQDEDTSPEEYLKFAKSLPESDEQEKEYKLDLVELATVYKEYSELKMKESKFDFGDLIIVTIKLFRQKPHILKKYHDRFKYILVDEYQDTNYTQNVLVNMLALGGDEAKAKAVDRKNANITVVGDDDQAIYKFRGAAISNILQFKEVYPTTKRIVLTDNYRSRQEILDAAYQLVSNNNPYRLEISEGISKKLQAHRLTTTEIAPVQLVITDTGSQEADNVAKEILKLTGHKSLLKNDNSLVDKKFDQKGQSMFVDVVDENVKYKFGDIAVLARANSHLDEFIKAFKFYGIPFKFSGPKGLYNRPEISVLISFLRTIAKKDDDISMFNILKMPEWGLEPREIIEIMHGAKSNHHSIFSELEHLWKVRAGSSNLMEEARPNNLILKVFSEQAIEGISNLLELYDAVYTKIKEGANSGEVLYHFFKESGYLESLLQSTEVEAQFKIQNISKYFDLIKSYEDENPGSNIFEYVDYLDYSMEIGESPKVDQELLQEYDAVNLSTVHSSKGLEFPVVFLVNLVSDRFPGRNQSDVIPLDANLVKETLPEIDDRTAHLQEERRLFYVGATRAKEALYLTAAKSYNDSSRKKKMSIFLDEILNRKLNDEELKTANTGMKAPQFVVNVSTMDDSLDISDIKLGVDAKMSYSQLSTYEKCPKQYKYSYILRLPGPASSTLTFGSTIHNTLKEFYESLIRYKDGMEGFNEKPTAEDLFAIYERKWISAGYDSQKHEEIRKEYGRKMLKTYYKELFSVDENPIDIEKDFTYKLDDTLIRGKIDRIDLVENVDGHEVVDLIDYKTGKVRDEKDVAEDLQLALYVLAVEANFGYKVRSASLLFVEHGIKLQVEVSDLMKEKVKLYIKKLVKGIRSGDFTAKPGFLCRYCDFRTICEDAMV